MASTSPPPSPAHRRRAGQVATSCACFNLRRVTRAVTQRYDDALRPAGLRVTQFTLLTLLQGHGALSVSELAQHSGTDRTTLTRNVALLESQGLVRIDAGDDARVRMLALTPAGARAVDEAYPLWSAAQESLSRSVGSDVMAGLLRDLARVNERVAQPA